MINNEDFDAPAQGLSAREMGVCLCETVKSDGADGPDSTTSGSNIPEGHADRPPEVEYSERLTSAKRQDEGGTEGLCSPHMELEMAVSQLQRDVEDCRAELKLARNQTPAVTLRGGRGSHRCRFQDTPGSQTGNSTARCSRPLCVRMAGTMSRRPYSCYPIWTEMHSTLLYWFRSLEEHYNAPGRLAEYKRQFQLAFRRPGDDPSV